MTRNKRKEYEDLMDWMSYERLRQDPLEFVGEEEILHIHEWDGEQQDEILLA